MHRVGAPSRVPLRVGLLGLTFACLLLGSAHGLAALHGAGGFQETLPALEPAAAAARDAGVATLVAAGLAAALVAWVDSVNDSLRRGLRRALVPFAAAGAIHLASPPAPGIVTEFLIGVLLGAALLALAWCRPLARPPAAVGACLLTFQPVALWTLETVLPADHGLRALSWLGFPSLLLAVAAVLAATALGFATAPRPGTGRLA